MNGINYLCEPPFARRFMPRRRIRVVAAMIDLALLILNDPSHAIPRCCHVEADTWEVKLHGAHGRILAAEDDRVLVD